MIGAAPNQDYLNLKRLLHLKPGQNLILKNDFLAITIFTGFVIANSPLKIQGSFKLNIPNSADVCLKVTSKTNNCFSSHAL
jgi:hypothetical protein